MGWIYDATPDMEEQSSWENILIATFLLTPLMVTVVGLRLWVRRKTWAKEDAVVVLAAVLSTVYAALGILQTRYGLGLTPAKRPPGNLRMYTVYNYTGRPFYLIGIGCFKVALCLSYLRFTERASTPVFRRLLFAIMTFVVLTTTTFLVLNIFGCTPISKIFDPRRAGTCLPFAPVNFYISTVIVFSDVVIFLLPIWIIYHVRMEKRKKRQICITFGLGLFTTVFSILRAAAIPNIAYGDGDPTDLVLYSIVELNVGIITSCFPYLRILLERKRTGGSSDQPPSLGEASRDRQERKAPQIRLETLEDRGESEESILRPEETVILELAGRRPMTPNNILQTRRYEVRLSQA
ncbi:hypothetical protein CAC42_4444 [Sphaceloma murrayae]|uniref:Rhodopsin domain-containing protein n=1 Tax=Sphaceloma murrayae TaxID=2082308 RepID=A0A2K1QMI3_9PEZI|nr:hypothetical protein CAC42_4444 [Sphaceloma murrayae]